LDLAKLNEQKIARLRKNASRKFLAEVLGAVFFVDCYGWFLWKLDQRKNKK